MKRLHRSASVAMRALARALTLSPQTRAVSRAVGGAVTTLAASMIATVVASVIAIAVATLSVAPAPALASAATQRELHLNVGQAHVLTEPGIKRIAIGNGKVIQATAVDDRQLLVIPEAAGRSSLYLWTQDGRETHYTVHVAPPDETRLLADIRALIGTRDGVSAQVVGDKVVVEGTDLSESEAARIELIAARYPQVVNLVSRTGLERMIEMDVRMVEMRREALRDLGLRWSGTAQGPTFGVIGDAYRSPELQPGGGLDGYALDVRPRVWPLAASVSLATQITSMLRFMVQSGDAVILAEPRLACRSGGSARFVAGGEIPIPVSAAFGTSSVSFKEYGVRFDVSPVASANGMIAAKIATELSAVNFEVSVNDMPGLIKRRAETEVNLREHETLVIAGLLTDEAAGQTDKVAGLGDLPILGKLFRSRAFRAQQTELVVLVTPRFVDGASRESRAARDESRQRLDAERSRIERDGRSPLLPRRSEPDIGAGARPPERLPRDPSQGYEF